MRLPPKLAQDTRRGLGLVAATWPLVLEAVSSIYRRPDSDPSVERALLVFGTLIHESAGMVYRRQIGFSDQNLRGAHGIAQMEVIAMQRVVQLCEWWPETSRQLDSFVRGVGNPQWYKRLVNGSDYTAFATALEASDRLSLACCHLYYLGVLKDLPLNMAGLADYWSKYYQTDDNIVKERAWLSNWKAYAVPVLVPWAEKLCPSMLSVIRS